MAGDAGRYNDCRKILYYLANFGSGEVVTGGETVMDLMDRPRSEREAPGARAGRDELVERIARAVREDGAVEAPGGLRLLRASSPTPKDHGVSSPAFCVIAQGSKEVLLGDDR